jgi:hypothetical protein
MPKELGGARPLVLNVQRSSLSRAFLGIILLTAIGVVLLIKAARTTGLGGQIALWVIGVFLLIIGVFGSVTIGKKAFWSEKTLTFDTYGVRRTDTSGGSPSWSVSWTELAFLEVMRSVRESVRGSLGARVYVELRLTPRDGAFRERHPELEAIDRKPDEPERYRVVVDEFSKVTGAAERKVINPLDDALRRFAPAVYGGLRQTRGLYSAWDHTDHAHAPGRG